MEDDEIDKRVEKQVERYYRKTAPAAGSRLSSPEGRERVRAAFAHQAEVNRRTRGVLEQYADLDVIEYPTYMCFTREVDRLVRFYRGPDVPEPALRILLFKYSTWGRSEPILRRLMAELFDIRSEDQRQGQGRQPSSGGSGCLEVVT
jgi:hypothetical protein